MRLIVEDRGSFPLARVVFGFQCRECGEEHRIGLNGSDLRQLFPSVVEDGDAVIMRSMVIVCSKCGSTGDILFTGDGTALDWLVEPEIS